MINNIPPIIVIQSNCHQPDLFMSWSLLAATDNDGTIKATENIKLIGPFSSNGYPKIITSIIDAMIPPRIPNKTKNQNSDLDALPEKTANLLKHVLIEVWKSITQSIILYFEFNIKFFKTYQKTANQSTLNIYCKYIVTSIKRGKKKGSNNCPFWIFY